tara:strand:+ start:427 stop:897 length:471 start_codon:yes stop_codon:yes gene_type:complete
MKRYIVVDTWNGDGYSDENGAEIKIFDDKINAFEYALQGIKKQHGAIFEPITITSQDVHLVGGYGFESGHDHGSFQVLEFNEDIYAVQIMCNVNEVMLLTKEQYEEAIKEREEEMHEAYNYFDREDYVTENNGDTFYSAIYDYDYQYRLVSNFINQ